MCTSRTVASWSLEGTPERWAAYPIWTCSDSSDRIEQAESVLLSMGRQLVIVAGHFSFESCAKYAAALAMARCVLIS